MKYCEKVDIFDGVQYVHRPLPQCSFDIIRYIRGVQCKYGEK